MPDPNLTAAIREAYASAPDDVVILHTLELRHPAFTQPIRVVRDYGELVATLEAAAPLNAGEAVTFLAYAFDVQLPEVMVTGMPELQIAIDNVSEEIEDNINAAAASSDEIEVTYRPFLSTDLSGPQMDPPLTLVLKTCTANDFRVTGRAGFRDLSNRRFPNEDYTIARFPGLVR